MSLDSFLTIFTRVTFVLIALLTLIDFARHRDRTRLDIALMFASAAGYILIRSVLHWLGAEIRWLDMFGIVAVIAHPFLILRLVLHFRPVRSAIIRLAMGGLVVSWALVIILPRPMPHAAALVIVAYFGAIEAYAAMAFVQGARRTGGVTHRRLTLVGVASGLIAAVVFIAGLKEVLPASAGFTQVPSHALTFLAALAYYLGFSTPWGLRRAWQLLEVHRFLDGHVGLPVDERATEMLDHLCETATRVIGGSGSMLALRTEAGDRLIVRASDHPALASPVFAVTGEGTARAWIRRRSVFTATDDVPGEIAGLMRRLDAETAYTVPVATKDHDWGLLVSLRWGRPIFPADDLNMLAVLAEQGAIALENAELFATQRIIIDELKAATRDLEASLRLQKTLRAQSIRDPLTGLFNRRYLEEMFERELHRAKRRHAPLGVIMLDLDHFKVFNDSYGHDAGDALLRALGQFLLTHSRGEDIACRYGGEEFVLIFPDASLGDTCRRGEQLRQEVERLNVRHRGLPLKSITTSVGVAGFPEHGSTTAGLLRMADEALYRAKTDGRDRVEVAQLKPRMPRARPARSRAGPA